MSNPLYSPESTQPLQTTPTLKTGDIILSKRVNSSGFIWIFEKLISLFTHSPYVHCALVLKDPTYIHSSLKGYYIWESSWEGIPDPQDGKIKLGVQITNIHDFLYNYPSQKYVRRFTGPENTFAPHRIEEIHKKVYDKPYDIMPQDWIEGIVQVDPQPQKTSRFWCSAFLSYVLVQIGLLPKTLDWSIVRPCDLSVHTSKSSTILPMYEEEIILLPEMYADEV